MKKAINILMVIAAVLSAAAFTGSCSKGLDDGNIPVIKDGYVRHVILWTLSEDLTEKEKLDVIMIVESAMETFVKEIPGLVKADVIYENRLDSSNCDFMFDMYFTGRDALEAFSVNPDHLAVVAQLKPYITGRTCLDVELQLKPSITEMDFAAIDFETANECRSSVCSVGVVIVKKGKIVDKFYSLINPEPGYYKWFCSQVHGLCEEDTCNAPVFSEVWKQIAPKIEGLPLVAHNACFDEGCLKAAFQVYQMDYPDYTFYDTLAASRAHFGHSLENHQLHTVAAACGYDLTQHHHALADAEACAAIALKIL